MANISGYLETIDHDPSGRNVKQAIHDALKAISEDEDAGVYDIAPECVTEFEPIEP